MTIGTTISGPWDHMFLHTDGDYFNQDFQNLIASLDRISQDPVLYRYLSDIGTNTKVPIYISSSSINPFGAFTAPKGPIVIPIVNTNPNLSDHLGYIERDPSLIAPAGTSDIYAQVLVIPENWNDFKYVQGVDYDFDMSYDRLLFHELMHIHQNLGITIDGVISPKWIDDSTKINFKEELSVFSENVIYNSSPLGALNGDTEYRLGHLTADPYAIGPLDQVYEGGSSGVGGFVSSQITYRTAGMIGDDTYRFTARFSDETVNTKTYHAPNYDILGDSNPRTTYDHYIEYNSHGYSILDLTDINFINMKSPLSLMLPDIMFAESSEAFQIANNAMHDVLDVMHVGNGYGTGEAYRFILESGLGRMNHALFNNFVGIGADRWVEEETLEIDGADVRMIYEVNGLIRSDATIPHVRLDDVRYDALPFDRPDGTTSPLRIVIKGDDQVGSVIAGASGFTSNKSPFIPNDTYIDATLSSDWLIGGSGSDLILLGKGGMDPANPNYARGGSGSDFLIGRNGIDMLYGDGGDDVFVTGSGADTIFGGIGHDTIDYHQSIDPVNLDMASGTGHGGDAEGDKWSSVENFIGSTGNDTFHGSGHSLMIGMEGNDKFHLKNGDVAYGGAGSDSFYITVGDSGSSKIAILDLESSDHVYINNQLFTGKGSDIPVILKSDLNPEAIGHFIFSPTGFYTQPFAIPIANNPVLDLYVAGFTQGDGDINLMSYYEQVPLPFSPFEIM
jgi:hypothetical protein